MFDNFVAYPVTSGDAISTYWSFDETFLSDPSNTPQFLYLYVTDYSAVAQGNTISSPVVVPLTDASGNLTTSMLINNDTEGMAFEIINGTQYHLLVQLVYLDANDNIQSANSVQSIVRCSTIPAIPNFSLVSINNAFQLQLLTDSGEIPTPISEFDGYGVLKGIFVTYASGSQLYSKFIPNDVSNNLYTEPQTIDASLNTYEISVASYNYNSAVAPNGNTVRWGGRSATSSSQVIIVSNKPGPVTDLDVYETMADYSNNMTQAATYTYVSNTIKWSVPTTGADNSGNTIITSYNIYRNNVFIQSVSANTFTYVDQANTLAVNNTYTYAVGAVNVYGEGEKDTVNIKGVVFPTQIGLDVDPSGNGALSMKVTNVPNGFPLANYSFDFSYNDVETDFQPDNPILIDGLTNGTTYYVQSRTEVESVNATGVVYTTGYSPVVSAVPYDPEIPDPTDENSTPLDLSGNPTGNVYLSWKNSNISPIPYLGQLSYTLWYKLSSAPDASYSVVTTANCQPNQLTYFIVNIFPEILALGTEYDFKVQNTFTGINGEISQSGEVEFDPVTPFVNPDPVRSLSLFNPTATDMSYSWLAPISSGGLPLTGYKCELKLLNDASNVTVAINEEVDLNDISGNLSDLFTNPVYTLQSGSQYEFNVVSVVTYDNEKFVSSSEHVINFTTPVGLDVPYVTNVDVSGVSLLNGIEIDWSLNQQYLDLDASNATFTIYRNGLFNPIASNISGTSYLDTTAVVGSNDYYQVVPSVNGVSGPFTPATVPVKSANITRIQVPAQPTNLQFTVVSDTDVSFSWTASTGGSGNDSEIVYLWVITDPSGIAVDSDTTAGVSGTLGGLTSGVVYTLTVKAGVENNFNNIVYYNNSNIPDLEFTLYDAIPQASFNPIYDGEKLLSSNGALVADVTNALPVDGLTFQYYKLEVATDLSFTNAIIYNSLASEFYASGLTNGTLYYARLYNVYKDALDVIRLSPVSDTEEGVPGNSPNQPDGVEAITQSAQSITVFWNAPTGTYLPNRYALVIGTDPSDIAQNINFEPIEDFSYNAVTNQYYRQVNGLNFGVIYYASVMAGIVQLNSISVSAPSEIVSAVPYTTPSIPLNLSNVPNSSIISSSWTIPTNTGGAGVGSNGTLYYEVQLSLVPSFNSTVTDVSGINQTNYIFEGLTPDTTYYMRVRAYFAIQNNPNNISYGSYATQNGIITQDLPSGPALQSGLATNTSGDGKQVTLTYVIDTSEASTLSLRRQIYDSANTSILSAYQVVDTSNVAIGGPNTYTFVDNGLDNSANFLNGNWMQYILDISYDIVGGSDYQVSSSPYSIKPYAKPIVTDASGNELDLSACIVPVYDPSGGYSSFYLNINKNGSDINSIVAVGLPTSENDAYVIDLNNPNIVYSNSQVNHQIAANQYAYYPMTYGSNIVNSTLVVVNNSAGTLLAKQPEGGPFGSNH